MAKKKNTQETYVAIRLSSSRLANKPSNRHILWIDEHWYETTTAPAFVIPESQIEQVKTWLRNHFQYYATFIYPDGKEIVWSAFADMKKAKPRVTFGGLKGISFVLKKKLR